MKINDIFYGPGSKLRSGWRFAIFAASYFFAYLFFVAPTVDVVASAFGVRGRGLHIVGSIASLIPALILGGLIGKYLEGLPFRALGASLTAGWLKHFVAGSLIGAGTICVAVALAANLGDLDFAQSGYAVYEIVGSMIVSFAVFAAAAAFEEAFFRGYILQTFARSGLAWFAILITSIFFGLVHLKNPNATWFAAINTAVAGIWFGIAYLKTRDLWLVWGLHLFWNWLQGAIFGIEVSGVTQYVSASLLKESDRGPEWLTGGNYGIEAGVACTIALIGSTAAIHYLPFLRASEEMMELQKPAR
jgi:uncharacterized protein